MRWFCLRGLVRETAHWGDFLPRLEKTFAGSKVQSLELAGNGERFREKSFLDLGRATDDLRRLFLKERGDGPCFLFALSLGGMIAADWVRRYPQDFQALVLVNSSFKNFSPFYERLRWQNYPAIIKCICWSSVEENERFILKLVSNKHGDDTKVQREWIAIQKTRPVSKQNAVRQILSAMRFQASATAPALPTLVLTGEGDNLVSCRCSKEIARRWGAELKTHPTAGHDLSLDEPEWVLEQLKAWLPAAPAPRRS